jgi:hypothetical protein
LTAASNWIMPDSDGPSAGVNVRFNPEITPADKDATRPSGLPTANTSSPICGPAVNG